jgi:Spy/CpxP family protein refolding chaperone
LAFFIASLTHSDTSSEYYYQRTILPKKELEMKRLTVATILIASLFSSNSLFAGEGDRDSHASPHSGMRGPAGGMGMPDPERMVGHISRMLELDELTTQELTNVVLAAQPQLLALREKARANHESVAALNGSESDYSVTIHALAAESGQIATEMTLLASQLRVDIQSKLTKEQRLAMHENMDNMRHRRDGKRRAPSGDAAL